MRFRVWTILWAFALLAAALATFDLLGSLATALVLSLWSIAFKKSNITLAEYLATTVLLGALLLGALYQYLPIARESARLNACMHNLGLIGKAIEECNRFASGLPYNWRVHLLPYLSAIESYSQDQGDMTHQVSRPLSSIPSDTFRCPCDNSGSSNFTSYLAIAGPTSRRSDKTIQAPHNIPDGPSNTIVILEAHDQNAWTDSKDLSFDEAVDLLSNPAKQAGSCHWREGDFLEKPTWVRNVLFADGTVRSLNMPLSHELAMALLTANGDERIDMEELKRVSKPELDYRKVYSLSVFVALSLLPIVNLRRQRNNSAIAAI